MNSLNVVVLTNPELGWDCVVGVYTSKEAACKDFCDGDYNTPEELEDAGYIFHEETLNIN